VTTVGWAVIGLLLGHVAAYDLVFPDAHVHDAALAESGHAWLGLLEPSLLIALGFVVIGAWLAMRTGGSREVRFRRLAVVQVAAFVVVELGERTLAGYSPLDLWHALIDHGLWLILAVGIVAQVITAWFGSAASRRIAAATQSTPGLPRPSRRAPRVTIPQRSTVARRPVLTPHGRAPPASLVSRGSM
jgi:hypothetical protein